MSEHPQGDPATLVLEAEGGVVLRISVSMKLGKDSWPGDKDKVRRFVADFQCRLNRNPRNEWMAIPNVMAPNQSLLNGYPLVGKETLKDGDVLAVGNLEKDLVMVPVTVRFATSEPAASVAPDKPADEPAPAEADAPAAEVHAETLSDAPVDATSQEEQPDDSEPREKDDADPSKSLDDPERERVHDFVHDILEPVFRDGEIEFCERTPVAIALIAYGITPLIDKKKEAVVRQIAQILREERPPKEPTRPISEVWATMLFPWVVRLAPDEITSTHDWLLGEARVRGQAEFRRVPKGQEDYLTRRNKGTFTPDSQQSLLAFCFEVLEHVIAELEAGKEELRPVEEDGLVVAPAVEEVLPEPEPEPLEELSVKEAEPLALSVEGLKQLKEKLEAGAEKLIDQMWQALAGGNRPKLAFEELREGAETKAVFVDEFDADNHNLWFVGDVHGDFVALEWALNYISRFEKKLNRDEPPYVVFLGDLVDRGHDSFAVVLHLFYLIGRWPGRVALLLGNHDEGLMWKDDVSEFGSTVLPSEFVDWLNKPPEECAGIAERLGKTLIKLYEYAPAALFLPGGTFAAHGGMPHCDLHKDITDPASLNSIDCVTDFIWTRVSRNSKHKEPNRLTRGCEFGYEDFYAFCKLVTERLDFPVKHMVRGHDHIEDRHQLHKRCNDYRMLTINNMSHRMEGEYFWNGGYVRPPCLARYVPDHLPEVHLLKIPEEVVTKFYPLPEPEPEPEPEAQPEDAALPVAQRASDEAAEQPESDEPVEAGASAADDSEFADAETAPDTPEEPKPE